MKPYDLAGRVREHTGEGLIELDEPPGERSNERLEGAVPRNTGPGERHPVGSPLTDGSGPTKASSAEDRPDAEASAAGEGDDDPEASAGPTAARIEEALERFTSTIREQIAHRAQAVGSQLVAGSQDLRHLEAELEARGFEPIASVVRRVSQGAEQLGRSLAEGDADRVAERLRDLTGSDPWKIVAGGFTAGLLAARAVKSYRAERPGAGNSRDDSRDH
jgi:hypothetical protein